MPSSVDEPMSMEWAASSRNRSGEPAVAIQSGRRLPMSLLGTLIRDSPQSFLAERGSWRRSSAEPRCPYWLGADATIPGGHVPIAVASGLAFLISEFADFSVYAPLRERTITGAVAASQVVGGAVDSVVFLWLAAGSLAAFPGQFVAKTYMVLPALLGLAAWRARRVAYA